jgi:branched-chain amino acid transport system substrate-binding protein
VAKYKGRFGEDPEIGSVYGYKVIDALVRAATAAGPELSAESFARAVDSLTIPPDIFGGPELGGTARTTTSMVAAKATTCR